MQSLTRKRTLRSSEPLWRNTRGIAVPATSTLPETRLDVVIIGAGIGGALMANALLEHGLEVLIIDRRTPVRGSTVASTAMIQHEIDVPLHKLTGERGRANANRIWQRSATAVESLARLVNALRIDCDFERKRTLYLAGDTYGSRALKEEVRQRGEAGILASYLTASSLKEKYQIGRTAAIESEISASANPAQMTAALLKFASSSGVGIVQGVEVTDIRSLKEINVLSTATGRLLEARHVVFCTGYEFLSAVANAGHDIVSTWAFATAQHHPRPRWLRDTLVWEGSDPYLYFRSTPDGRIIAGGEDELSDSAFQDPAKLKSKAHTLRRKLSKLLGVTIEEPAFRWAAAFGVTSDGLPLIGPVPGLHNVYAAMGYGGNGITFSQIAAEIISASILGHRDPDAELFDFATVRQS